MTLLSVCFTTVSAIKAAMSRMPLDPYRKTGAGNSDGCMPAVKPSEVPWEETFTLYNIFSHADLLLFIFDAHKGTRILK
jgi:hypothetical protein